MLFDYVRIRFPTTDVKHIVEDVLRLRLPYFIHEDYGFYSYTEHYYLGDIFVLVSPELEKGVLLELKGRGCRQFESYLLAQERSWYEFFMDVLMEDGVMKRLDLAINDKTGILNIPHLTEKCRNEECISVFRSFKSYRSGELVRREEKECMGNTLYIGSLQSEVYFCIYEKDYEQYKKHDIPIADAEVKNRFEIRLKNERAFYAIRDLLEHDNPERTAFQIINRYVRFVDRDNAKPRSDWRINEEWAWFIGEHRGSLKLTTKPEPYSLFYVKGFINRMVELARHQYPDSHITFHSHITPDDLILYADENLISQVLINLLKNAIQAIEAAEIPEGIITLHAYCNENEAVLIEVSNNGPAILSEVAEHIFIPFFTTKEGGSGIGLSISRQIMRLSGGSLSLHPGKETMFVLKFN